VNIVADFDQNTSTLPTGFVAAVDYVVSYFDSLFTNKVTVTIDVGFGEIGGQSLQGSALGESLPVFNGQAGYGIVEPYGSVRSALLAQYAPGANTLPASAPADAPANLVTTQAEAKALGLIANNGNLDGYVGFDAAANTFSYSTTAGPAANTPQFTAGAASYFSIDNGVTDLDNWNNFQTGNTGDLGDWAPSAGNDAFDDNGNPGVVNAVTATDLTLMNAIGWTSAPPLQIMLSSDVFWLNGDGTLAAWTVAGPQEVTFQGNPAVPDPALWSVAGIGDFNRDGNSDILWRNINGTLVDWSMNGSQIASDQYVTYQGKLAAPDASWQIAGIGDFNGNGTSDVL
jgi:hypothetical protein